MTPRPVRPGEVVVGVIANPRSGHDVRRLVARASVFPNVEKVMMLQRVLTSLAAVGVDRVVSARDAGGVSGGLERAVEGHHAERDPRWPVVELLDLPLSDSADDSAVAAAALVRLGVQAIVVLGGDGTCRVVASACDEVPIVPLSTGTNNAFAHISEASVAGLAAGLLAGGRLARAEVCRRNKVLVVDQRGRRELALVDVAVTSSSGVGARAVWSASELMELFVTFADPSAVGLSSIAGLVRPIDRDEPTGLHLTLDARAPERVLAPLAPGLVSEVGIVAIELLPADEPRAVRGRSVVALDGERELELRGETMTVTLSLDGPWSLDVDRAMAVAAARRLLCL